MLEYDLLTDDQQNAITRLFDHDETLIIADMGAGKTVCALTAIDEYIDKVPGSSFKVLVLGTLKVCNNVWKQEQQRWRHLSGLNVAIATGTAEERIAAIESDADIVCMNFENLPWFFDMYGNTHGFGGLVIDEVSKLKNSGGSQFKKLRHQIKYFSWHVSMTGTPVAEDFIGLFGECLITDGGKALGRNKQKYLDMYFYPTDYERRNWKLLPGSAEKILDKIKNLTSVMPDYRHELPPLNIRDVIVEQDAKTVRLYKQMKANMLIELAGAEVVAQNAAVLTQKLQQIAQGFIYPEAGFVGVPNVNTVKLDKLSEILSGLSEPVMVVYWFKEDLKRLQKKFPLGRTLKAARDIEDWNAGRVQLMFVQPRSMGHGLNLAEGGYNMVFYSMVWSNDLIKQVIARLWRRGQKHPVTVRRIIMKDTVDEIMITRTAGKEIHHDVFIEHLKG